MERYKWSIFRRYVVAWLPMMSLRNMTSIVYNKYVQMEAMWICLLHFWLQNSFQGRLLCTGGQDWRRKVLVFFLMGRLNEHLSRLATYARSVVEIAGHGSLLLFFFCKLSALLVIKTDNCLLINVYNNYATGHHTHLLKQPCGGTLPESRGLCRVLPPLLLS